MQPSRRPRLARVVRAFAALTLVSALVAPSSAAAAQVHPEALRVVVDPGHGGAYSGAYYGGIAEKTLNLQIARRVVAELRARGIDASLTRDGDYKLYNGGGIRTWRWIDSANAYQYKEFDAKDATDRLRLDLQARADKAMSTGADLFVSVHCNAGGTSAQGIEVYSSPNDPLGAQFAADLQDRLIARTGAVNRGRHQANFYVTRWSNQPAALVECGFMSNATERGRLRSASYQTKLANGIADGIERFAGRGASERFERIGGATRYETAVAVSREGWPEGADTVFLASGEQFADSLVAAPLAAKSDAPILTSSPKKLDPAVRDELARLAPERIVVVGGTASIPETIAASAALASGITTAAVERIAGKNRYEVSLAVARAMASGDTSSVVVASGEVWPDALSIAGSAAGRGEPILLVRPTGLTDEELAFVTNGGAARTVTAVGGKTTLPDAALRGLRFTRIAGADRYETNWQVLQKRATDTQRLGSMVASGERFPDALVLGPLTAKNGRPVLLVGKTRSSKELRPWVYGHRNVAFDMVVVGGTASVSAYLTPMFDKWHMDEY